jgi:hypothetical protein
MNTLVARVVNSDLAVYLSEALKIDVTELLPNLDPAKRLGGNITKLRTKRSTISQ